MKNSKDIIKRDADIVEFLNSKSSTLIGNFHNHPLLTLPMAKMGVVIGNYVMAVVKYEEFIAVIDKDGSEIYNVLFCAGIARFDLTIGELIKDKSRTEEYSSTIHGSLSHDIWTLRKQSLDCFKELKKNGLKSYTMLLTEADKRVLESYYLASSGATMDDVDIVFNLRDMTDSASKVREELKKATNTSKEFSEKCINSAFEGLKSLITDLNFENTEDREKALIILNDIQALDVGHIELVEVVNELFSTMWDERGDN